MKIRKDIMGASVEIFSIKTKQVDSYFVSIEYEDAQYVGKTLTEAEFNSERLVVEYLRNKYQPQ